MLRHVNMKSAQNKIETVRGFLIPVKSKQMVVRQLVRLILAHRRAHKGTSRAFDVEVASLLIDPDYKPRRVTRKRTKNSHAARQGVRQ
jgi:hypothetical protein